jgi:phosphatidylinositol alpha-1,6-mannosyltransferase
MKKILIFSLAYAPHMAGAEIAVKEITDRLGQDYEFDLITCRFGAEKAREKIGNVSVYRVGFGSRIGRYLYPALAYRLALKLHRRHNYNFIWAIMAAYAGAAGLFFKRAHPEVKFLLTLQEGDSIEHIHRQVRGFKSKWREVFRKADYIQAISKYLADWAHAEGARCPVEMVPNGVDLKNFQFSIHNFQSISKDKIFKVITVSRLVHKNGIDILIRALAQLPTPNSRLQILGSGPGEKMLKKLAKDLGIEKRVEFMGHVSQDDLPAYLAAADIFVRPSRSEGLGISFLEAMSSGVPVIAPLVGGITDFLQDGETGLVMKSEDPEDLAGKIKQLMQDENLRKKLQRNGRELVEQKYNWDNIAKQIGNIIHNLSQPSPTSERARVR